MAHEVIADGLQFPEGPAFDRSGNLYVVEIMGKRVIKIAPDRTKSVLAEIDGAPNGLALGPDGNIYVCNNGGFGPGHQPGRIERISMDGEVAALVTEVDGEPLHYPNDLTFDPQGNFYFSDPLVGPRGGELATAPPADVCFSDLQGNARRISLGLCFPNGVAITPDGTTLLVCETGTFKVHAYPILEPGVLGAGRVFGDLGAGAGPDGMCLDAEGYLLVCGHGSGKIFVFPPGGGAAMKTIDCEDKDVTNVCFGGPEFRTLFITESRLGRVVSTEWERPGMRLFPDR